MEEQNKQRQDDFIPLKPYVIENKHQGHLVQSIIRGAVSYVATKKLLESNLIGGIGKKNAGITSAFALGTAFISNLLNTDSNLKEAVVSSGLIAGASFYAPMLIKRNDAFYERIGKLNTILANVDNFHRRYKEAKLEAFQRYFVERDRVNETRIKKAIEVTKDSFDHVFKKKELKRSNAYNFLINKSDDFDILDKIEQGISRKDYAEIESSLPSDKLAYALKYFNLNRKIDNAIFDSTKLLSGASYFTNINKKIKDGYGNVDVLGVFKNNLNKDIKIMFDENERIFEYKKRRGIIPLIGQDLNQQRKTFGLYQEVNNMAHSIKKEMKTTDQNIIYENLIDKMKESDNIILQRIAERQAKPNELNYGSMAEHYNDLIFKHVKNIKNRVKEIKKSKPENLYSTVFKDSSVLDSFRQISNIKNTVSPFMINSIFRKNNKELLSSIVNNKRLASEFNEFFISYKTPKEIAANKVFNNLRIHKNIEINSKGKVVDTSITDMKNIFLSSLSNIQSNLKPYFKSLPFLGKDLKKFDFTSPFGLREKVIQNLDDSELFAFRKSYYDHNKSLNELEAHINSLEKVELLYKKANKEEQIMTYPEIIKQFNAGIKKLQNENKISDPSSSNYKYRFIGGGNIIKTEDDFKQLKTAYKNEYNKRLAENKNEGIRYREADETKDIQNSYYTFSSSININQNNKNLPRIDVSVYSKLQNPNSLIIKDNKLYGRMINGEYEKLADNVEYTTNNFVKKIQSNIAGTSYTTHSNGQGIYVEENEINKQFNFKEFEENENKFKYLINSDLNFLPFSKKKVFNDEANIFSHYKHTLTKNAAIYKKLKAKNRGNIGVDDILSVLSRERMKIEGSKLIEQEEVNNLYNNLIQNREYGSEEVIDLFKNIKKSQDKNLINLYDNNKDFIDHVINDQNFNLKNLDHLFNANKIIRGATLFDESLNKDTLNKARINIEIKNHAIQIKKSYKNILERASSEKQLKEIVHLKKVKTLEKVFKISGDFDTFKKIVGEEMEDNLIFNKDKFRYLNRDNYIEKSKATIINKSFKDVDFTKGKFIDNVKKIIGNFNDKTVTNNKANVLLMEMVESAENVFNVLGVSKLHPENKISGGNYIKSLLIKRVFPMIGAVYGLNTLNSLSDIIIPDPVPFLGEGMGSAIVKGLAAARMMTQILINTSGLGFLFRAIENQFPGTFTGNGLFAPLDLSDTNQLMYEKLYEGREVAVKKNRFWFTSGRQPFEGSETKYYRPHLLYLGQHRGTGIYNNKIERFFRKDFLPTSLTWYAIDPYKEEKELKKKGINMPKSEQLFTDVPIFGGVLNTTLGQIIKPTKYFNENQWRVNKDTIINPNYDSNDSNTQPFIKIKEANLLQKSLVPAYNDLTELFGMRGYYAKVFSKFMFGGVNKLEHTTTLDSLDRHRGITNSYEGLELGGMFGTTEGIRRIISSDKLEQDYTNPLENNITPDWMPNKYYKNFKHGINNQFNYFADTEMAGQEYEKIHGLHSDEKYGKYGLLDRLRILSINAPYSSEYKIYKSEALKKLMDDNFRLSDKKHILESLSYGESIKSKNTYEDVNMKAKLKSATVNITSMPNINEFIGKDGKRYKLAGFNIKNFVNENISTEKITKELQSYLNFINKTKKLDVIYNANKFDRVKSDEQGEYIEVYSPDLEKFKHLISDNYLRSNYNGRNPFKSIMNYFNNLYKPYYLEKSYNRKNPYERWYEESVITPEFKDWEQPYKSFVAPMLNLSGTSFKGYLESQNIARKVGDGNLFLPIANTMSYIGNKIGGYKVPKEYTNDQLLKNTEEYQEHLTAENGYSQTDNSFFDIRSNDSFNRLKSYLSPVEKKYFNSLVNVKNEKERQLIYKSAGNRMKIVLDVAWNKQRDYIDEKQENIKEREIETAYLGENFYNNYYNNPNLNSIEIKKELGFKTNSYENVELAQTVSRESFRSNSEYIRRLIAKSMLTSVKKQTVLSTIFGVDASFIYNKENHNN